MGHSSIRSTQIYGETVYAFLIPVSALKQEYNRIGIASSGGEVRIKRIEIALKYGDVETHGYF